MSSAEEEIGVTVVSLEAEYALADLETLLEFERRLLFDITAAKGGFVIDFGKTSFFKADFLITLLRCHLSAKSGNRRIVLCGLKTWARKVFAVPRLDSLWEIFDTRQEASEAILALGIDTANTQFEQAAQGPYARIS